jgi:hypothetical protein
MILLSRAEEIILMSVYKLHGDAYGVTIREQVKKDIGRYWSFGVIYKTRYYYEITPAGISALEKILKIHSTIWSGFEGFRLEKKTK